jgi:hypothetical protein
MATSEMLRCFRCGTPFRENHTTEWSRNERGEWVHFCGDGVAGGITKPRDALSIPPFRKTGPWNPEWVYPHLAGTEKADDAIRTMRRLRREFPGIQVTEADVTGIQATPPSPPIHGPRPRRPSRRMDRGYPPTYNDQPSFVSALSVALNQKG